MIKNNKIEKIYKNRDIIFIATFIVLPFIYILNPIMIMGIIGIQIYLIFKDNEILNIKMIKLYILFSSYFGITIFKFKLYDLLLFWYVIFIAKKVYIDKSCITKKRANIIIIGIIYFVYLTVNTFFNGFNTNQLLELTRCFMSIITMISMLLLIENHKDISKTFDFLKNLAIGNIIMGVLMFILAKLSFVKMIYNYNLLGISINIFDATNETRIAGIFSDPNKFFAYFTIILIVYEVYNFYFNENEKIFDKYNSIFMIAIISSFSRTGIIMILVYIITKFIAVKLLKKDININLKFWSITLIIVGILFVIFNKQIIYIMDRILVIVTEIMGREEAFVYSPSISESSRIASSKIALQSMQGNLFTGVGLSSWSNFYYMPPHNSFVSVMQESGLFGITIFLCMLIYSLRVNPIHINITLLLLPMLTLDLQSYRMIFLLLSVGVVLLEDNALKFRGNINENNNNRTSKY